MHCLGEHLLAGRSGRVIFLGRRQKLYSTMYNIPLRGSRCSMHYNIQKTARSSGLNPRYRKLRSEMRAVSNHGNDLFIVAPC